MEQLDWKTSSWMFPFLLILLVFVLGLPCCNAEENELCYLKHGENHTGLCVAPRQDVPCCHEHLADIKVTVYKGYDEDKCDNLNACGRNTSCCNRSLLTNVTWAHSEVLKKSFSINCFRNVTPNFLVTSMPDSNGAELVVVSYTCSDESSDVGVVVAVPITSVIVVALVVVTVAYLRKRLSRKDVTNHSQCGHNDIENPGSLSKSMGLLLNHFPSRKAKSHGTIHYYSEIADCNTHYNQSAKGDNNSPKTKSKERNAKNAPTQAFIKTEDFTCKDEYDHLDTQDTCQFRRNNYHKHIPHILNEDGNPDLYDRSKLSYMKSSRLDEENYDHTRQSEADDGEEGDYVGLAAGGPQTEYEYSTVVKVQQTNDCSINTNKYFVLEKQF